MGQRHKNFGRILWRTLHDRQTTSSATLYTGCTRCTGHDRVQMLTTLPRYQRSRLSMKTHLRELTLSASSCLLTLEFLSKVTWRDCVCVLVVTTSLQKWLNQLRYLLFGGRIVWAKDGIHMGDTWWIRMNNPCSVEIPIVTTVTVATCYVLTNCRWQIVYLWLHTF